MGANEKTPEEIAIEAVAEATAPPPPTDDPNHFVLSNGVVIRFKPVPIMALRRAVMGIEEPEIPQVWNEEDQRFYENPESPEYAAALEKCYEARILADQKMRLTLGVELVSVPDGIDPPNGMDWVLDCQSAGIEPNLSTERTRFVEWLQLYALSDRADVTRVMVQALAVSGVTEQEVMTALQYFRNQTLGIANNGPTVEAPVIDGDRVSTNGSGPRPRNRGARSSAV